MSQANSNATAGSGVKPTVFTLGLIAIIALGLFFIFALVAPTLSLESRYLSQPDYAIAWVGLAFYAAWWLVYLGFSTECDSDDPKECMEQWEEIKENDWLITVRTALEFTTIRGTKTDGEKRPGGHLVDKARVTVNTVGIIMGFSLLLFTLNIELLLQSGIVGFDRQIAMATLLFQVIAILFFLVSVDSLTGTLNRPVFDDEQAQFEFTAGFYKRGVLNYYRGLIVLVFSVLLFTITISPIVTAVGVFVLTFIGYEYWFDPLGRLEVNWFSQTSEWIREGLGLY